MLFRATLLPCFNGAGALAAWSLPPPVIDAGKPGVIPGNMSAVIVTITEGVLILNALFGRKCPKSFLRVG